MVLGGARFSNVGDNLVEAWGSEAPLENSMLAGLDDVGEGEGDVQSALLVALRVQHAICSIKG